MIFKKLKEFIESLKGKSLIDSQNINEKFNDKDNLLNSFSVEFNNPIIDNKSNIKDCEDFENQMKIFNEVNKEKLENESLNKQVVLSNDGNIIIIEKNSQNDDNNENKNNNNIDDDDNIIINENNFNDDKINDKKDNIKDNDKEDVDNSLIDNSSDYYNFDDYSDNDFFYQDNYEDDNINNINNDIDFIDNNDDFVVEDLNIVDNNVNNDNVLDDLNDNIDIDLNLDDYGNDDNYDDTNSNNSTNFNDFEIDLDFDNVFFNENNNEDVECDNANDGLILSLANLGRVDIEYISKLTGLSTDDVILELKGSIFQNPMTWEETSHLGWETKEEYLSGNLKQKYKIAKEANEKYNGIFENNLKAISEITKDDISITINEIYFTLGSPWIPTNIIKEFIDSLIKIKYTSTSGSIKVKHDKLSGSWSIHTEGGFYKDGYFYDKYSTPDMDVFKIIEKTLNQSPIEIKDKPKNEYCKPIKNDEKTALALEKQKLIVEEFKSFVLENEDVKARIVEIYNNMYCQNHIRFYSGDFLTFPGLANGFKLFDYQKNAVARIIFSKNTLLAHDVGSGKTYVMIAAGQELRRMKLSKKNMFVVPNGILSQWVSIYKTMYPKAKLLVVSSKNFNPQNREKVLQMMRDIDYDGIIITYSSFKMIPLSPKYFKNKIKKDLDEKIKASQKASTSTRYIQRSLKNSDDINKQLQELGENDPNTIYFDDLNIDRLFVDEAHNYKNVTLDSDVSALGIRTIGSAKCDDMMDKVRFIQQSHDGGGVVFATGTPITNSITDIYVIQKYLQNGDLELLNLSTFNAWISNFAEKESNFEIDVDTSKFRIASRYSKFHNLPELSSILSNVIDFHKVDKHFGIPDFNGYSDIVTSPDEEFKLYLQDISERADLIRHHNPRIIKDGENKSDIVYDNMLLITNDGRKAALDLRLVKNYSEFKSNSKVNICANIVFENYIKTNDFKGTQLIFCDVSTPKNKFNIYTEMKRILIELGMKEDEIQFIHDYESVTKKEKLFERVRNGEVRVLMGSTFKLGTGVNVQDKLYAIHHIDVPWRPSDLIQRDGRILRLGNSNSEVFIYRYVLRNSFDAYSWQLLETKQNFISKILNNSIFFRDASDIDEITLNYAEIKALAIGQPLLKERVELYNKLLILKKEKYKNSEVKEKLKMKLFALESSIPELKKKIKDAESDYLYSQTIDFSSMDEEEKKKLKQEIYTKIIDNMFFHEEKEIGEYFGFKIIAPAYQSQGIDNLTIFILRNGKYVVKLGKGSTNLFKNIEQFLEDFNSYIIDLKLKLRIDNEYKKSALFELEKEDNYEQKIQEVIDKLAEVDEILGVKMED